MSYIKLIKGFMKKLLIFPALVFISLMVYADEPEQPTVIKFNNLLTLKTSLIYNLMIFEQTAQNHSYITNQPIDVGAGIGIKDFFISFSLSIPFLYDRNFEKSKSFNANFYHYFKDRSFFNGFFGYFDGFHDRVEKNIDLRILTIGLSQTFILNRNHSIRTAYNLDGKQKVSNGSLLFGGGLFFTSIRSDDNNLEYYFEQRNSFFFGPSIGYSYTFIIKENFFINILSTFSWNGILNNGNFAVGFQALPRFSIGYHGKRWSINFSSDFCFFADNLNTDWQNNQNFGEISLSFLTRFF